MRWDPILTNMVKSDVVAVISLVVRDHLGCECVDHTDREVTAEHLAKEVADMLETEPDVDGSYAEFAKSIHLHDRGMK